MPVKTTPIYGCSANEGGVVNTELARAIETKAMDRYNRSVVNNFLLDMFWLPWSEYVKVVLIAALAVFALVFSLLTLLGGRVLP